MLFDDIEREAVRRPRRTEPSFGYLNASGRPQANVVRETYDDWANRFPTGDIDDLVSRFRHADPHTHAAAAFELCAHEALHRLGADRVARPAWTGGTNYDFDVLAGRDELAVEASIVTDVSDQVRRRRATIDRVLDALDGERPHPTLVVGLRELIQVTPGQPSPRRVAARLRTELDRATTEELDFLRDRLAKGRWGELPVLHVEVDGLDIEWTPLPRSSGSDATRFAVPHGLGKPFTAVTIQTALREKVREKATKHYALDGRPLILMLGVTHDSGATETELIDALFGTERIRIPHLPSGELGPGERWRDSDGVWKPTQLRSVSAVLAVSRFDVWTPWEARWWVVANPWASRPCPAWLLRLPHWRESAPGELRRHDGLALSSVLQPIRPWPVEGYEWPSSTQS